MGVISYDDSDKGVVSSSELGITVNASPYSNEVLTLGFVDSFFTALQDNIDSINGAIGLAKSFFDSVGSTEDVPIPDIPVLGVEFTGEVSDPRYSIGEVSTSGGGLNFRTDPKGDIITTIPKGAQIEVTGEEKDGYLLVRYQGREGWVSSDYVKVTPAKVTQQFVYGTEMSGSTEQPALENPSGDASTDVSGTEMTGSTEQPALEKPSGDASTDVSGATGSVKTEGGRLYLRTGAGKDNSAVALLDNGTEFTVLEQKGGWTKIQTKDGLSGWVYSKYTSQTTPSTQQSSSSSSTQSSTGTQSVETAPAQETGKDAAEIVTRIVSTKDTNGHLNIRTSPNSGDSSNIIGQLDNRTEIKVLKEEGGWSQIEYNGQTAWVSSKYLS